MATTTPQRLQLLHPQGPVFAARLRDYITAPGAGGEDTMQPEYIRFDDGIGQLAWYIGRRYQSSAGDEWATFLRDALWEVGREAAIEAMIAEAGEWVANRADADIAASMPGVQK